MSVDRVIEVLLAAMTLIIGYTSFAMATRTTRIEKGASVRAVDAGAFERAKVIYEGALDTLREELSTTHDDLTEARAEIANLRAELASTHRDLNAARSEIVGLRQDISNMRLEVQRMRDTGGQ